MKKQTVTRFFCTSVGTFLLVGMASVQSHFYDVQQTQTALRRAERKVADLKKAESKTQTLLIRLKVENQKLKGRARGMANYNSAGAGDAGAIGTFVPTGSNNDGYPVYVLGVNYIYWSAGNTRYYMGTAIGVGPFAGSTKYLGPTTAGNPAGVWTNGTFGTAPAPTVTLVASDTTAPTFANAAVVGSTLTINWTEANGTVGTTGLALSNLSPPVTLSGVSTTGNVTTATLSRALYSGEAPLLNYTPGNFADAAGNAVAAFAGQAVTNASTTKRPVVPMRMGQNGRVGAIQAANEQLDPAILGTGVMASFLGDGSDGSATISTTVTLSRNMNYDILLIANGGNLKPNGYLVNCKTLFEVQAGGIISNDGNNASGATPGAGTSGNYFAGGVVGKSGASGVGTASTGGLGVGGSGGSGGNGTAGAGGTSAAQSVPAQYGDLKSLVVAALGSLLYRGSTVSPLPGQGGASGAGDGSNAGGGGGSGAGWIIVNAKKIVHNGVARAKGGNGGVPSAGNCGGGGGGGGGPIFLNSAEYSGSGTFDSSGGTGGSGIGTGTVGGNGTAGLVQQKVWS